MMKLVPKKRAAIVSRYKDRSENYPYFFYEEDPEETEYSKFITDDLYSDDNVKWHYIVDDSTIVGICALAEEKDELWIKFIEISKRYQGNGYGSEAINYIIDKTDKRLIRLFPKDENVGTNFYQKLGFKWLSDDEMYFLNWGPEPNAKN